MQNQQLCHKRALRTFCVAAFVSHVQIQIMLLLNSSVFFDHKPKQDAHSRYPHRCLSASTVLRTSLGCLSSAQACLALQLLYIILLPSCGNKSQRRKVHLGLVHWFSALLIGVCLKKSITKKPWGTGNTVLARKETARASTISSTCLCLLPACFLLL